MQTIQENINVQAIYDLFEEYRNAYGREWERLEKCERMYRGDHWHDVPEADPGEPRPVTPIIQSTIENIRADLVDQYPQAIITADSPEYGEIAEMLTGAIRENHIRAGYAREYAKLSHDLLVGGYMVQEAGFDKRLNCGMGGAFIREVDPRSIMFDPLCPDIGDGRAVFKFVPYPRAWFRQHYPDKEREMEADGLLEDSARQRPEGYYAHGEYPFVVTALYPRRGSCLGFGLVDMFENQQLYSDKLDQIVLKNALMASHNKLLVTGASGFDIDDLRDWSKEVHRGENLNGVTWFSTAPLPGYILDYIRSMRNGIKEESGANDFSRGMATGGVTAASAIAALQEMSSKRSRMAAKAIHDAFEQAVRLEIEVEREYCIFPRKVHLKNRTDTLLSNKLMKKTALGNDIPLEFTVSVKVQRENRFSVTAHNELMLSMLKCGMITADVVLEMMVFDGKEQVQELMTKKLEEAEKKAAGEKEKEREQAYGEEEGTGPIEQELAAKKGRGAA